MDALDPFVMEELIQDHIDGFRDDAALARAERKQEEDRLVLTNISSRWGEVAARFGA